MGHIGLHQPEPALDELFETTKYQFGEYLGLCRISAYSELLGAVFEGYSASRKIITYEQKPLVDFTMDYHSKDSGSTSSLR